MKPVRQTTFGPGGNCFAACLASILELKTLAEVPEFDGWGEVRCWLRERGWRLTFGKKQGWAIASQRVVDGSIHAVVCRDGWLVHDPSPRPFGGQRFPVILWIQIKRCKRANRSSI